MALLVGVFVSAPFALVAEEEKKPSRRERLSRIRGDGGAYVFTSQNIPFFQIANGHTPYKVLTRRF